MRLVIDLQGAQTESRFRGIGRYSLALAEAMARNRADHEVVVFLNDAFPHTIPDIWKQFQSTLDRSSFRVWSTPTPVRGCDPSNAARRRISENIREAALESAAPDVVLISSLFEGFGDDAVTSVGNFDSRTPTASILYDLIPLITPDEHFKTNAVYSDYYNRKLQSLQKCTALLAISESARQEAIQALHFPPNRVTNISGGCESRFQPVSMTPTERSEVLGKLGLTKSFLMYTGGADERKNLKRLIQGFALLPAELRAQHQLLIAGKMPEGNVAELKAVTEDSGLAKDDVVFSGFVSDTDLLRLYTAAKLFVFPSIHEGLGMPPLEAMACGTAVIASNASSLPEVIGNLDALFDPTSVGEIANKMQCVLQSDDLRETFVRKGFEQVKRFCWDKTARAALRSLESAALPSRILLSQPGSRAVNAKATVFEERKLRILVSKLDHRGDLLLALPAISRLRAKYPNATIDAVVGSWNTDLAKSIGIFANVYSLDVFSDSSLDQPKNRMDLSTLLQQMQPYDVAIDLRRQPDTRRVFVQLPASLKVAYQTFDESIDAKIGVCLPSFLDLPRIATDFNHVSISLQMLALVDALPADANDYLHQIRPRVSYSGERGAVAVFPLAGNSIKEWGLERYIDLVQRLDKQDGVTRVSIFLPNNSTAELFAKCKSPKVAVYSCLSNEQLQEKLATHEICIANNSYGAHLSSWLGIKTVALFGGHETVAEWQPVFGNTRILSAPVACSPCHLPKREDCPFGIACLSGITVDDVASAISTAMSDPSDYMTLSDIQLALVHSIAPDLKICSNDELEIVAQAVCTALPQRARKRIYVDISELVSHDARTGIQRVVRSILSSMFSECPFEYDVFAIYASSSGSSGYLISTQFTRSTNDNAAQLPSADVPVDWQSGDIFVGLDLSPTRVLAKAEHLKQLHRRGVQVVFVVYDILPVRLPHYFDGELVRVFIEWLTLIKEFDGAICISNTTRSDLLQWYKEQGMLISPTFTSSYFHLGADIENSTPSLGLPEGHEHILHRFSHTPTFLVVGTLEPRKGHEQVLDAFDLLWDSGTEFILVFVGKRGWQVDKLCERIKRHAYLHSRLFWLESTSDEFLERIYESVDCLIAPSFGEGFGLPLIEAAKRGIPIIARDLPVFREVAGAYAEFFNGRTPGQIARAVREWHSRFSRNEHIQSAGLPYYTWAEASKTFMALVTGSKATSSTTI